MLSPCSYDLCKMGNCMFCSSEEKKEKIRVLIFKGGEMEFKASTPVKKIASGPYSGYKLVQHNQPYSPLPPDAKLQPGGVYYLVPHLVQPLVFQKPANGKICRPRRVKIVMTRQQLELLKQRAMKVKCKAAPAVRLRQSFGPGRRCRKWQPSLSAIPEMKNY